MENVVLYLIGFPGIGKLTIANEIAATVKNTHVVDNHKTNNVIFPFVDLAKDINGHPMWPYIREIRDTLYRFIIDEVDHSHNFIFTAFLIEQEKDYNTYNKVVSLAEKREALFVPIKLVCNFDTIRKRMQSAERLNSFKLTNTALLDDMIRKGFELINITHPNMLTLDVTNLGPSTASSKIIEWIDVVLARRKSQ